MYIHVHVLQVISKNNHRWLVLTSGGGPAGEMRQKGLATDRLQRDKARESRNLPPDQFLPLDTGKKNAPSRPATCTAPN